MGGDQATEGGRNLKGCKRDLTKLLRLLLLLVAAVVGHGGREVASLLKDSREIGYRCRGREPAPTQLARAAAKLDQTEPSTRQHTT